MQSDSQPFGFGNCIGKRLDDGWTVAVDDPVDHRQMVPQTSRWAGMQVDGRRTAQPADRHELKITDPFSLSQALAEATSRELKLKNTQCDIHTLHNVEHRTGYVCTIVHILQMVVRLSRASNVRNEAPIMHLGKHRGIALATVQWAYVPTILLSYMQHVGMMIDIAVSEKAQRDSIQIECNWGVSGDPK